MNRAAAAATSQSADRAPLAIIPAMIVMSDRIEPSSVRPEAHSSSTPVLGPIGTASLM
ncbi:hypothetical protein KRR38_19875 [Novosphingobium sp. G106]|uniref:hypothetical protein n=1 Tax=Novosphingobium sp. G106 TaxID=2849500 RepID=UPI001C2D3C44|nr:hypothetical protein [Novosphingobium sp. G106]MBV1689877.1 hypothetical protein [Novosphingobium sp. G106]